MLQTLGAPTVHLCSCGHRLYLPCYAALHVRAADNVRYPAFCATVVRADSREIQQRSKEAMTQAMTVARGTVLGAGEGGLSTRGTRGGVICSTYHGLVSETAYVHVSFLCEVHHRCVLGLAEGAIPRAKSNVTRGTVN